MSTYLVGGVVTAGESVRFSLRIYLWVFLPQPRVALLALFFVVFFKAKFYKFGFTQKKKKKKKKKKKEKKKKKNSWHL